MLNQRVAVNGSSINKIENFKLIAGVMNVIDENEYIFEYCITWVRSYVTERPPTPRSAFWLW